MGARDGWARGRASALRDGMATGDHSALEREGDGAPDTLVFLEAVAQHVPCVGLRLSHRTRLDALARTVRMREALADGVVQDGEQEREWWRCPLRGKELELVHACASNVQALHIKGGCLRLAAARDAGGAAEGGGGELHEDGWCDRTLVKK